MTAIKTIKRRFRVGRHTATLSVPLVTGKAIGVSVEWDSDRPPRLSRADLEQYRQLRNAILRTVATEIGGTVLVVDQEADGRLTPTVIEPEVA
jgi:hypothetical protein